MGRETPERVPPPSPAPIPCSSVGESARLLPARSLDRDQAREHDSQQQPPPRPPARRLPLPGARRRHPLRRPGRQGGPRHGRRRLQRPPHPDPQELVARAGRICQGHAGERCTEVIHSGSRCPTHARAYEVARGLPAQRGYGREHRRATARAVRGATHCPKCGSPFTKDNPATGGHVVARRRGGDVAQGIEAQCRRCNYGWRKTGL